MFKDSKGDGAEFALIVRSDLQRKGLGEALLRELVRYARSTGVTQLHGAVSAENGPMLDMGKRLGFISRNAGDGTLREIRLSLKD